MDQRSAVVRHPSELLRVRREDAGGSAHPELAGGVFEDLVNGVAGKAVGGCEPREFAGTEAQQAVTARAQPESALRILVHGPDLLRRYRGELRIGDNFAVVHAIESLIGTHQNIAGIV